MGRRGVQTGIVHNRRRPSDYGGLINPPVYRGSTVLFPSVAELQEATARPFGRTFYGRMGTPTVFALENASAALYGEGVRAVAVGSGLAALACAITAFASAGDKILVADSVYAPTRRYCVNVLGRLGVETVFYDPMIGGGLAALMDERVKLVVLESPGSLTFEVQDIAALSRAAKAGGAVTLADNTWATALYFNPFKSGVDVVVESATKYIVGHADVSLGLMLCGDEHFRRLKTMAVVCGQGAAPDDCYLAQRGLRTLGVRLPRHEANALALADWLAEQEGVRRILHPARPGCPGHELWRRDFSGSSGLFSVILEPAAKEAVAAMVDGLELFGIGYSWGSYESLILPVFPQQSRTATRWDEGGAVLRIHAGLEDASDLIDDLKAGLKRLRDFG